MGVCACEGVGVCACVRVWGCDPNQYIPLSVGPALSSWREGSISSQDSSFPLKMPSASSD